MHIEVIVDKLQMNSCINHIKYRVQLFEENIQLIFPDFSIEFVQRDVSQKALIKSNISPIILKLQSEDDELIYLSAKESVEFWNLGFHSFSYKPFVRECLFYQLVEELSGKFLEINQISVKCYHFTSYSYEDFCQNIMETEVNLIRCLPTKKAQRNTVSENHSKISHIQFLR